MSDFKFELDLGGLNELMSGAEMQDVLNEAGDTAVMIAENISGEKFGCRTHVADYVAICNVYPDSEFAAHRNYRDNTCLIAVESVRL